jgi:hypothetical protein
MIGGEKATDVTNENDSQFSVKIVAPAASWFPGSEADL